MTNCSSRIESQCKCLLYKLFLILLNGVSWSLLCGPSTCVLTSVTAKTVPYGSLSFRTTVCTKSYTRYPVQFEFQMKKTNNVLVEVYPMQNLGHTYTKTFYLLFIWNLNSIGPLDFYSLNLVTLISAIRS